MEGTFSSNVEKIAELPREKIRPFDQSLLVYSDDRPVLITQRLQKNILIHSTSEIEVSFSSQLEDVILVAPKIVIQEFVSGTFQAFATDSIIVKTGVKLGFPSVLGVLSDHPAKISLNSAQIQGCVFGYSRTNAEKPTIRIDDYSVVIGEVYVDGFLELYGRVSGTVACTNFLLARYGEIRENNLLDGTINRGELSKAFIFSLLHAENPKGGIVKWL